MQTNVQNKTNCASTLQSKTSVLGSLALHVISEMQSFYDESKVSV